MQQRLEQVILFDAKAATGSTIAFLVADWQNVFLSCYTTDSANFTLKVQASNQIAQPDFSAAASLTNQRAYVQIKDLITNTAIN